MAGTLSPPPPYLALEELEAPLALCDRAGVVQAVTGEALTLLRRLCILDQVPAALPRDLWQSLDQAPVGHPIEWRPPTGAPYVLGCTRYRAGARCLVLMNEISDKHAALSRRLHRHRLESTGRLVASIAHELRNSVASIIYNADFLAVAGSDLPAVTIRETAAAMLAASRRLQFTVDGLLDYARLGPTVSVPVSIRDVLTRAQGFLRTVYHRGEHILQVEIDPAAEWVRGNSLSIEQIFVNLLLNAAQASDAPIRVVVSSDLAAPPGADADAPRMVRVRVIDDGPGVPERLRESVFEPFFTTREHGTGLGLANAREAAVSLGGALVLEASERGACFAFYLPRGDRQ